MKTRSTKILVFVVVALAALFFYVERRRPTTREKDEKLFSLVEWEKSRITGMDITNGERVIQLRKKAERWVLIKPVEDRANSAMIEPILQAAANIGRFSVIGNLGKGSKLRDKQKDYGVQKGKVRLKLLGEGAPDEIHFGKDTAFEGKIYARLASDDVISVVKSDLRNLLIKDADDFRDKHLTALENDRVTQVKIKTAAGEIVLKKSGDSWDIIAPIKARAADERILDLISNINQISVEEFITPEEGNLAKYGLAEPLGYISLSEDDENEETIQIGSSLEKDASKITIRVVGRPSVFVVPKDIGVALGVKPNDLRDNKLTRVPPDLLDRITIDKAGQPPIVLQREQDNWKFLEDNQPANAAEVKRLIDVLNNTEAKSFVDDTPADVKSYGLEQPVLTIRLSSYSSENTAESARGEKPLATIQFGATEGESVYARLLEEPFVISVGAGVLTNLPTTSAAFRKAP